MDISSKNLTKEPVAAVVKEEVTKDSIDKFVFEVPWRFLDVTAIEESKNEQKYIILFIFKEGCEDCSDMFLHTFRNHDVMYLINKDYIPCVLSYESNPALAESLIENQNIYPMTLIVPHTDEFRIELRGYISPKEMVSFLNDFSDKGQELFVNPVIAPPPAFGNKVILN